MSLKVALDFEKYAAIARNLRCPSRPGCLHQGKQLQLIRQMALDFEKYAHLVNFSKSSAIFSGFNLKTYQTVAHTTSSSPVAVLPHPSSPARLIKLRSHRAVRVLPATMRRLHRVSPHCIALAPQRAFRSSPGSRLVPREPVVATIAIERPPRPIERSVLGGKLLTANAQWAPDFPRDLFRHVPHAARITQLLQRDRKNFEAVMGEGEPLLRIASNLRTREMLGIRVVLHRYAVIGPKQIGNEGTSIGHHSRLLAYRHTLIHVAPYKFVASASPRQPQYHPKENLRRRGRLLDEQREGSAGHLDPFQATVASHEGRQSLLGGKALARRQTAPLRRIETKRSAQSRSHFNEFGQRCVLSHLNETQFRRGNVEAVRDAVERSFGIRAPRNVRDGTGSTGTARPRHQAMIRLGNLREAGRDVIQGQRCGSTTSNAFPACRIPAVGQGARRKPIR